MRRFGNFFLRKKNEDDTNLLEPPSPPVVSPTSAAAAASAAMAELHIDRDLESPSSVSSPMSPGSRAPGKFALEDDESTWPWATEGNSAPPGDILDSGCNSVTYAACPEPLRRAMMAPSSHGSHPHSGWCVRAFALLRPLGGGKLSAVWLAQCRRSLTIVALKLYPKKTLRRSSQRRQIAREIRLHSRLQEAAPASNSAGDTLLRLYAAFEDGDYIAIVLEHAVGGDLFVQMQSIGGRLTEHCAVNNVIRPTLIAMHHMHANGILHRDIKPENLMFVADDSEQPSSAKSPCGGSRVRPKPEAKTSGELMHTDMAMSESWFANKKIRVADFGLSVDLAGGKPNSRVGTLDYMAPEVIMCGRSSDSVSRAVLEQAEKLENGNSDPSLSPVSVIPDELASLEAVSKVAAIHAKAQSEGYSVQVDAWAVGVLAYEILMGRPPFGGENRDHKRANIVLTEPHYPNICSVSKSGKECSQISDLARDFIQGALRKDPDERLSIADLISHPWLERFR